MYKIISIVGIFERKVLVIDVYVNVLALLSDETYVCKLITKFGYVMYMTHISRFNILKPEIIWCFASDFKGITLDENIYIYVYMYPQCLNY